MPDPDPPTMNTVYPGFESDNWNAMFFPKGVSKNMVAKINAEVAKALKAKDVQDFPCERRPGSGGERPGMKFALRNNRDFLTGLPMIGVGAVVFYMALDCPFGSALRMDPGYLPRVLAGIFIAFGSYVGARGLLTAEKVEGVGGWKALAFIR